MLAHFRILIQTFKALPILSVTNDALLYHKKCIDDFRFKIQTAYIFKLILREHTVKHI